MTLFHADLDNTLIYSSKHDIGPDKVGVEEYQNRIISFMTPKSFSLLGQVAHSTIFVPTTTRTAEQYSRINLGIGCPDYALVCNGGVLLVRGQEDQDWYETSLSLASDAAGDLRLAFEYLEKDAFRCFEVHDIRSLFVFTKSERPEETVQKLRQILDVHKVDVLNIGMKVYVLPKQINKGTACLRLKERVGADCLIAAGDSEFDIPMLNAADISIAPKKLCEAHQLHVSAVCDEKQEVFSDFLLEYLEKRSARMHIPC